MAPAQPNQAFYELDDETKVTLDRRATRVTNIGLGITIKEPTKKQTVLVNSHGDTALPNGCKNETAVRLIALTMEEMRKRKMAYNALTPEQKEASDKKNSRVGEKPAFNDVIKVETHRMLEEAEYPDEALQTRHTKVIWKVLTGFDSAGDNEHLDKIIALFAKYRLGSKPTTGDEFYAALQACHDFLKLSIKDSKKRPNKEGEGYWCISIVHMMNHYMKFKELTPIAFTADYETDEIVKNTERRANTNLIWNGGKKYKIDSRESVLTELRQFGEQVLKVPYPPIPVHQEQPVPPTTPPPKKRRRTAL